MSDRNPGTRRPISPPPDPPPRPDPPARPESPAAPPVPPPGAVRRPHDAGTVIAFGAHLDQAGARRGRLT